MSSTLFTGTSRYSSDFQQIVDRAVAIASLQLSQLNSGKTALQAESTALSTLDTKFTALQSAISSLAGGIGASSYTAAVSDGAVVSATVGVGALAATYQVEVTSLGAYSSAMSKDGLTAVTDPSTGNISSASSFTLTVGGTAKTITPGADTLNALVTAINEADAGVQASIVNIGTTASPDYRLAIQSTRLDAVSIQLNDGTADLMSTLATGAKAAYKLNGLATAVQTDSRTVTLAPGLTVTLVGQSDPGVAASITVSRNTTAINNALTSFVAAYNAALETLDAHRGKSGGALSGQVIILTLWQAMRDVAQYAAGSGTITSLTDLGLTFDDKGKLSFDTTIFANATSGNVDELLAFLGSTTGSGFLKSATDILNGLEGSTSGLIKTSINSVAAEITAQDSRIEAEQDRVDQVRASLVSQMSAADALIASLEQQATYMTGLFESMRIASQLYK